MKKILILITILCLSRNIYAQFNYGMNGGINISTLGIENNCSATGFTAGIFAEYYLPSSIGFDIGLNYSQKGSSFMPSNIDDEMVPSGIKTRLNYFDIPIGVLYKIQIDPNIHILFNVGGYYAYGAKGSSTLYYNHTSIKDNDPFGDFSYEYNNETISANTYYSSDYGCMLGVGSAYKHIRIKIDYQLGLKDLSEGLSITNGTTPRNRTWCISLGYAFKAL